MKYHFFWGGPFSNWAPAKFTYKDKQFSNSEQAFMWEKAITFGDDEIAEKILIESNPAVAKSLGRMVKNFSESEWVKVRYQIMVDVNIAKFSQNESLKQVLLNNQNFVEASPEDNIWGIGMDQNTQGVNDPNNWKGLNLLGKALDDVRSTLLTN